MSSGRHRRRMNWEGVVLNQRLAALNALDGERRTVWVQHHGARAWLERTIALRRADNGVDQWEDDGGALYGGAGAE